MNETLERHEHAADLFASAVYSVVAKNTATDPFYYFPGLTIDQHKAEANKNKDVDYYSAERIGRLRDRSTKGKKTHHNFGWWNID